MSEERQRHRIVIDAAFAIGEEVVCRAGDSDDDPIGIVHGYQVRPGGSVVYAVNWGPGRDTDHYEIELLPRSEKEVEP